MPEVEFTLPTAQYASVKVRATPEELGLHGVDDAYELGVAAAVYLNLFQQGYKTGSQMDVSGPVGPSKGTAHEVAHRMLDEALGGVTELPDPHAPGGSHYADPTEGYDLADRSGDAPWTAPVVDAKPKPWETGVTAPAVLDAAW